MARLRLSQGEQAASEHCFGADAACSDPTLAFKTFLRAIEMATDPDAKNDPTVGPKEGSAGADSPGALMQSGGWEARPWWDVKLVSQSRRSSAVRSPRALTGHCCAPPKRRGGQGLALTFSTSTRRCHRSACND